MLTYLPLWLRYPTMIVFQLLCISHYVYQIIWNNVGRKKLMNFLATAPSHILLKIYIYQKQLAISLMSHEWSWDTWNMQVAFHVDSLGNRFMQIRILRICMCYEELKIEDTKSLWSNTIVSFNHFSLKKWEKEIFTAIFLRLG